jgi:hypothetical protein
MVSCYWSVLLIAVLFLIFYLLHQGTKGSYIWIIFVIGLVLVGLYYRIEGFEEEPNYLDPVTGWVVNYVNN